MIPPRVPGVRHPAAVVVPARRAPVPASPPRAPKAAKAPAFRPSRPALPPPPPPRSLPYPMLQLEGPTQIPSRPFGEVFPDAPRQVGIALEVGHGWQLPPYERGVVAALLERAMYRKEDAREVEGRSFAYGAAIRVAEIGTFEGASATHWIGLLSPGSTYVAIDQREEDAVRAGFAPGQIGSKLRAFLAEHEQQIEDNAIEVIEARGDWHQDHPDWPWTFDLVVIDDDHHKAACKDSAHRARARLHPGGVLVFDDAQLFEVREALEELAAEGWALVHIAGSRLVVWQSP